MRELLNKETTVGREGDRIPCSLCRKSGLYGFDALLIYHDTVSRKAFLGYTKECNGIALCRLTASHFEKSLPMYMLIF